MNVPSGRELAMAVRAKDQLADGVVALTLESADGRPAPSWEPGAHVDLVLGADLVRQYSLCGDPADRSALRVAVLREPSGRGGSAHVHDDVRAGHTLVVRGPRNNFPLVEAKHYLFVAGGIGITPIVPMVRACAARGADWRLVYGGRRRASMAFRDTLEAQFGERVTVYPEEESGLLGLASILDAEGAGTAVYCCGPEPLITAMEIECKDRPELALHVERFSPKSRRNAVDGQRGFEVELARSGRTVIVPAGVSIVDALAEQGVEVETSCREGTCGTCETAVLDGEPDHRDSLLTEEEQAMNDVMFLCVSRSRTEKLVLDL